MITSLDKYYDDGYIKVKLETVGDKTKVRLEKVDSSNTDRINYLQLIEGNIIYPHQEEDDSIAHIRCSSYIKKIRVEASGYCISGTRLKFTYNYDVPMESKPTVVVLNVGQQQNVYTFSEVAEKDFFYSDVFATNVGNVHLFNRIVILTCEPL